VALGAAAVVAIALVLAVARAPARGADRRAVSASAESVTTVVLRGVPGRLTVAGVAGQRVSLTGQLHWTGRAPALATAARPARHRLQLSYHCAAGSPCTGDLRLAVPRSTAVVLDQPSGQVTVTGLAGPLRITARSVDISAAALRCPALAVSVTSGHLSASFARPPGRVAVTLASAQATLHLPASVAYRVSQRITSGYLRASIPQASGAARVITARVDSGELELLPG
jgi:hypothetical protein